MHFKKQSGCLKIKFPWLVNKLQEWTTTCQSHKHLFEFPNLYSKMHRRSLTQVTTVHELSAQVKAAGLSCIYSLLLAAEHQGFSWVKIEFAGFVQKQGILVGCDSDTLMFVELCPIAADFWFYRTPPHSTEHRTQLKYWFRCRHIQCTRNHLTMKRDEQQVQHLNHEYSHLACNISYINSKALITTKRHCKSI